MKTLILSVFLLFISLPAYADTQIWNSSSGEPVVHSVEQSPEEVEEYWTPERMRNAQPMPMPSIDGSQGVPMPTSLEPCIGDQCSESGAEGGYAVGSPGNPGEW
jgi:hypothetical protein